MHESSMTPCSEDASVQRGRPVNEDSTKTATPERRGCSRSKISGAFAKVQKLIVFVSSKLSGLLEHAFSR